MSQILSGHIPYYDHRKSWKREESKKTHFLIEVVMGHVKFLDVSVYPVYISYSDHYQLKCRKYIIAVLKKQKKSLTHITLFSKIIISHSFT